MRVGASTRIAAPPSAVWEIATNPENALALMSGITRWEPIGDRSGGLGARYRMLLRIGAAEVGGLIEFVEWERPSEFAWTSVTGIDQRGRLRLRRAPGEQTIAEFRFAYGIAGAGLSGWVAERLAAPTVSRYLHRSLEQLKRQAENEQIRERAAARRAPRPAAH